MPSHIKKIDETPLFTEVTNALDSAIAARRRNHDDWNGDNCKAVKDVVIIASMPVGSGEDEYLDRAIEEIRGVGALQVFSRVRIVKADNLVTRDE